MSVYNGEQFLRETVDSILTQDYDNFEFLIVDDASTDGSWNILSSYKDPRIKIFQNKENKKLAHNLNFCISKSVGKYIARIDADDICISNRFSLQVDFLETHPNVDVLGGQYLIAGAKEKKSDYPQNDDDIKAFMLFKNPICHPAVMFRVSSLDLSYDECFTTSQDYDLWTRLSPNHVFYNLKESLIYYRLHSGQTANKNGKSQNENANKARLRLLSYLGTFSLQEIDIFNTMCSTTACMELSKIRDLAKKILEQNSTFKVFKEKSLKKALQDIYNDNVLKNARKGYQVSFFELFRNDLYLIRHVRFGIKFVLYKMRLK